LERSSRMKDHRTQFRVLALTGAFILPFLVLWEKNINAASVSDPPFVLTLKDNHLSAKIVTVSLINVLEKLAQLTNVETSLDRSVANETVSAEFNNLPLEEGIRRILQGKSYALTYARTSFSNGRTPVPKVVEIRVVSKNSGPGTAQRDADFMIVSRGREGSLGTSDAGKDRARESAATIDPQARMTAITTLKEEAEEKRMETLQAVIAGLSDEDSQVREAALEVLKDGDGPVPLEPLSEVALRDASPEHRMDALMLLAERNGQAALGPLNQAVNDPDPGVSEMARTLLKTLKED